MIFGQGKTAEQVEGILRVLLRHEQGGLATRIDAATAAHLVKAFPEGRIQRGRPGRSCSRGRATQARSSARWSS